MDPLQKKLILWFLKELSDRFECDGCNDIFWHETDFTEEDIKDIRKLVNEWRIKNGEEEHHTVFDNELIDIVIEKLEE